MIVGERAAIDVGSAQTGQIIRMHAVVDALAAPVVIAAGDRGLEVDDACIRFRLLECFEHIAPHVVEVDRLGNAAAGALCDADIICRGFDVGFIQHRCARLGQDLIDTSAGHDVAAQKQRHRLHSSVVTGVRVAVKGTASAVLSPDLAIKGRERR